MNKGVTAVITLSLLGGCASIQPPRAESHRLSVDELRAKAKAALQENQNLIHATTVDLVAAQEGQRQMIARYFPGARLVTSVDKVPSKTVSGETTVFTNTWQSSQVIFESGEYTLQNSNLRVNSEMVKFRTSIAESIDRLQAKLGALGVNFEIIARYKGCADSVPMRRGGGVVYRGEWGNVEFDNIKTTVNGAATSIKIRPGERLTNTQLAALRGRSVEQFIRSDMRLAVPTESYEIDVGQGSGGQHRCASVAFHIQAK